MAVVAVGRIEQSRKGLKLNPTSFGRKDIQREAVKRMTCLSLLKMLTSSMPPAMGVTWSLLRTAWIFLSSTAGSALEFGALRRGVPLPLQ